MCDGNEDLQLLKGLLQRVYILESMPTLASPRALFSVSVIYSAVVSPVLSGSALLFSSSPGKVGGARTGVAASGVSK